VAKSKPDAAAVVVRTLGNQIHRRDDGLRTAVAGDGQCGAATRFGTAQMPLPNGHIPARPSLNEVD
jgi:hypothetical protein